MTFVNGITTKKYAWKVDLPDHRDFLYDSTTPVEKPSVVDLRAKCSPVENQSTLGSCTANALVGSVEFLHRNFYNDTTDFSRLFVYYNERLLEGTVKQDAGAMLRDGIKVLAKAGVCSETTWPYLIETFKKKPSRKAYLEAKKAAITSYYRLSTLDDMIHCLASGFPFVFGFSVYDGFESEAVAKSGVLNLPTPSERCLGGHAVEAVGYNMETKRFIVRNSWGTAWGDAGYFTIPFEYVSNPNLADDFWTVRK